MKVLQVNKLYYPYTGGIENVIQQVAEGLNDKVEMKVLVCNTHRKTIVETINGVKVTRSGSFKMVGNLPLSIKFLHEFKKQAANEDVILFHMPNPLGDLAYLLSAIRNKKIVLWWHSDVVRQKKMLILYRPLLSWMLKKADKIIVATEGHIKGSKYLHKFKDKCVVIPYGIKKDIELDSKQYVEQKREAKDSSKRLNFLFVGRLVYYKGCNILLEAFKNISEAQLTIVGDGPLLDSMRKYVMENDMQERVIFKYKLSDEEVYQYYRQCDVLILPSVEKSEAFGIVQIEAMSYGKPVINTKLDSGVPYVSLHGMTGLTIPVGDSTKLCEAIKWFIRNPKQMAEMGKAARLRVLEQFTNESMVNSTLHLITDLYNDKSKEV